MCGILGSLNIVVRKEDLNLISHRGPDSYGLDTFKLGDHELFLGHKRLAIVDLTEAGHQPMFSACGNYGLIFNGEIYNHNELRLKMKDVHFKGHSDTETILYYLKKYGIEGLKDFNGIFAIAFFDFKDKKVIIARDPHGVKPLYYFQGPNSIIFSSEIRGLRKHSSGNLNIDNLATLLKLRYNLSPETIFSDIKKVRPGHYLEVNYESSELTYTLGSFFTPQNFRYKKRFRDAVKDYGQKITSSVERQLMSDVEVGVLLSGGIDSALVAALASKKVNYRIKAFTVGFEGQDDSNEIEEASRTAELLDLEHHAIKIGFDDFLGTLRKCNSIVEEPIATTSFVPMYYLSALASKYVKVVLSGQGADEPLGGYFRYKGEVLHSLIPTSLSKVLISFLKILPTKKERLIRGINSLSEPDDVKRFVRMYSIFSDDEIFKLINHNENKAYDLISYLYDYLKCTNTKTSAERMMRIDSRGNLSDDLLMYSDKITMNFSLENRVPLLDLDFVQFVESLPSSYKVKFGKGKIIHKEFAKSLLPSEIINRPKKGFKSPTEVWFKSNIGSIKEILLSTNTNFSKYFDQKEIQRIISRHLAGENMEKQIFLLLSLCFWFEENSK
ncbi:MAG: hypothetical protein PWQ06_851 [Anaerophaga sp.]|nr:hypothetical protein [Anaerophaga sp.]